MSEITLSAIEPGAARIVVRQEPKTSEFLGDRRLALFKADDVLLLGRRAVSTALDFGKSHRPAFDVDDSLIVAG